MEEYRTKSHNIFFVVILGIVLITLFVLFSFFNFSQQSESTELEQRQAQLKELAEQEAFSVKMLIDSFSSSVSALADALTIMDVNYTDPALYSFLAHMTEEMTADNIMILDTDGKVITTEQNEIIANYSFASEAFFKRALIGMTAFSSVKYDPVTGKDSFMIGAPIYEGDKVKAVLVAEYLSDSVAEFLDVTSFEGEGYSHIFQTSDGKFVSYSSHAENDGIDKGSFFRIADVQFDEGYTFLDIFRNVHQGNSGLTSYTGANGEDYYGYYAPVGTNNWYVFTVVPTVLVDKYVRSSANLALHLIIRICAAFLLLLILTMLLYFRYQKDLLDANEKMRISEESIHIALEHVRCIIFTANKKTGKFEMLKEPLRHTLPKFTYNAEVINAFSYLVSPECMDKLNNVMATIRGGAKNAECMLQVKYVNCDHYEWVNLTLTNIFDNNGNSIKYIGTLEDVNDRMEREKDLKSQAEMDPLTGIANRVAIRGWIDDHEKKAPSGSELKGAYILIDIDNFKHFNDAYGHTFGDIVLKLVATQLSEVFAELDDALPGRIGGDEFAVLTMTETDRDKIIAVSEKFCKAIADYRTGLPEGCHVSVSLGIAFPKHDDRNFIELFDRADKALYKSKESGKNQVCVYSEDLPARPD